VYDSEGKLRTFTPGGKIVSADGSAYTGVAGKGSSGQVSNFTTPQQTKHSILG